jgi:hypothetical protein
MSYSELSCAAQCRRAWFSQYALGRKSPPGDAANFGKRFEELVCSRLATTKCPAPHRVNRPDAPVLPEVVPTGTQIIEASKQADAAEERLQSELVRAAEVYLATPGALQPLKNCVGIVENRELLEQKEIWFEPSQWAILSDYYGIQSDIHLPILGYIDLLERSNFGATKKVVDLKTSSRKAWNVGWALQTLLYSLHERAQTCEIHLTVRPTPKLDENGEPVQSKRPPQFRSAIWQFAASDAAIRWMMGWIASQAKIIRADNEAACIDDLPANPGYQCAWCPENSACEAYFLSKLSPLGGGSDD